MGSDDQCAQGERQSEYGVRKADEPEKVRDAIHGCSVRIHGRAKRWVRGRYDGRVPKGGILAALVIIVFIKNMITFSYQARDASGRIVSGIQDALNEDNAVTSLMSRGLMVLSLQKKAEASRTAKKIWSVKETDIVLVTRQLATMIEAGISLIQALTALYEQSDGKKQKN